MKLVDSSSWIHQLRTNGDAAIRGRVEGLLSSNAACWCAVVQLELWNGARGDREKAVLERMELLIPKLPINEQTWNDACVLARRAREPA